LDKHGFRHDRPYAAGPDKPRAGREDMQQKKGQFTHDTIVASRRIPGNNRELAFRHAQVNSLSFSNPSRYSWSMKSAASMAPLRSLQRRQAATASCRIHRRQAETRRAP